MNSSRMGHVALSIMIVQSGSLMYTFLNNNGSSSTWSEHQILLLLSLAVDTLFRVYMFLWCFSNSCCYCKIIAACSRNDCYRPHPQLEQAVQQSYTELNLDINLQFIVPQDKCLEAPGCPKCEVVVSPSYSGELSIFVLAIPESEHSKFAEHKEYVCPERQIPQSLMKEKMTMIVV